MLYAEKSEYWNAVGLNAVHCAISISDALMVKYGGVRSIDSNHMVVIDIMRQKLDLQDIDSKLASLRRMLSKKSLIEYDNLSAPLCQDQSCSPGKSFLIHPGYRQHWN